MESQNAAGGRGYFRDTGDSATTARAQRRAHDKHWPRIVAHIENDSRLIGFVQSAHLVQFPLFLQRLAIADVVLNRHAGELRRFDLRRARPIHIRAGAGAIA